MMLRTLARALEMTSFVYLVALVVCSIALFVLLRFSPPAPLAIGCQFHDALVIAVNCNGFLGASVAEAALNWPLLMLYALLFASWETLALRRDAIFGIGFAIALWAPLIYLVLCQIQRRVTRPWHARLHDDA
jgi:hypothetical protein